MPRCTRTAGPIGLLAALLASALAGHDGAAAQSATTVTDSAGVRITTTDAADRGAGSICSLAETPDTRVTSPASGEWWLHEIEDLDRMDDGRLIVLNRGSHELLLFGADGEFLQSIGRLGEGPGEFMDPIELDFVGGDSIVVWDWKLGRLSLFGPDGSHGRSLMLRPPMSSPTGHLGVLGWGGIAIAKHDIRSLSTRLEPTFLQVLRYDRSGALLDTLATLPYGEQALLEAGSMMAAGPLFDSRGLFLTHGDLLYTSNGESPEVRVHREARLEAIVRWNPGDLSVSREDVEAYGADYLERLGASPLNRKRLDAFPAREAFPAVVEIRIDPRGRLWTRSFARPGSTTTEWLGFAETGEFVCSLSVPRSFRVFRFDASAVVGVHRDEMDVESVEVTSFTLPG